MLTQNQWHLLAFANAAAEKDGFNHPDDLWLYLADTINELAAAKENDKRLNTDFVGRELDAAKARLLNRAPPG